MPSLENTQDCSASHSPNGSRVVAVLMQLGMVYDVMQPVALADVLCAVLALASFLASAPRRVQQQVPVL
jgi:hypothetical protein